MMQNVSDMSTKAALREMIFDAGGVTTTIITPIVVGLLFGAEPLGVPVWLLSLLVSGRNAGLFFKTMQVVHGIMQKNHFRSWC